MSKPENQFISGVHKYLKPGEPHHEKMHNMYRGGTADVWYSGNKADLWIEYKFLPRVPQRGSVKANLSVLQMNWLTARYAEGRSVYVVVGCPAGGVILCSSEWEHELPAGEFTERVASRKELAQWITQRTVR